MAQQWQPNPAVVIDNGTGYTKMGYAGNCEPSFIVPSVIGTKEAKNVCLSATTFPVSVSATTMSFGSSQARKDWKGVEYTGLGVWHYVCGAASVAECTPGSRDVNNVGMRPADFLARANDHVRSRLPHATADDLLTLEEVLSIRLYTGARAPPPSSRLQHAGRALLFAEGSVACARH